MTMESWEKIAYTIQLIAACLTFMLPARKRENFVARVVSGMVIWIVVSYVFNTLYEKPIEGVVLIIYWLLYIVFCVAYIWLCLEATLPQAIYCTVCSCGMQHVAFDIYMILCIIGITSPGFYILVYAAVYIAGYFFCAKNLPENGRYSVSRRSLFPIASIFIVVWVLSVLEDSSTAGFGAESWQRLIYRIIDGECCLYILWVQVSQKRVVSLQRELDGVHALWRQQKKQYEMTSESIDSINRKCHDLKHQIHALRIGENEDGKREYLEELEKDIMIYDASAETGNRALDIVLMEKGLFCRTHNIQWTCMADGERLNFMRPEDIYSILGNALDNAIEAVENINDPEKKVISVKIISQNEILVMQIQNYYDREVRFEQELPVTTKKDKNNHGFGVKSIRYTAEKYNGTVTVRAEQGIFTLQVLIPVK